MALFAGHMGWCSQDLSETQVQSNLAVYGRVSHLSKELNLDAIDMYHIIHCLSSFVNSTICVLIPTHQTNANNAILAIDAMPSMRSLTSSKCDFEFPTCRM